MVLDGPLNMLCDSPSNYRKEPESTAFIADVPTVWDETRVLDGKIGEYIVTARRKGDTWWIGGITDWTPRDIEVDLTLLSLGAGSRMELFADGVNAHRNANDYVKSDMSVAPGSKMKFHLAPGGGFAAKIRK